MARGGRPLGPDYRRLWLAATISNVGDGVFFTALPLLAVTLTRDPVRLSVVTFSLTLPWLLFALISGALVDRWNRITVMWRVDLFRFVVTAALAGVIVVGELSIPLLAAFGFALGSAETLFDTASLSAIPSIVGTEPEQLTRANARLDSATLVANGFVGPAAGARLFIAATALPVVANAVSFAVSALVLRQIHPRPVARGQPRTSLMGEIHDGLKWLRRQPLIATLAVAVGLINLCTAAAFTVLVLYLQERAGIGSIGYSLILIAAGTGGVLGNIVAETFSNRLPSKRVLPGAIALTALGLLIIGSSTTPVVIGASFAVIGLAGAIWNVQTVSLRQRIIPSELLGRINSLYRLVAYGTLPIGAIGGGVVARLAGLSAPFLAGGAVLVVTATLLALRLPSPQPIDETP